jgi:3-hydroxyacyl-CoA dehydrogenase
MAEIKTIAVIGSGVMGAAIAAHAANSGAQVLLFDMVPEGETDRHALAKNAIARLLKADPAPLTKKSHAKRIRPANLEDDLALLGQVDWVIEAVLEDIDIKRALYQKIIPHCPEHCVISSNTSTIPLATLVEGLPSEVASRFFITHFFNPPRYMRLLELVCPPAANADLVAAIRDYADKNLGKGVVDCHDTPGFIANRIGCFWMTVGVLEAMRLEIPVEDADQVMGRPFGIPKTGVFALLDLIGIDLMPLIAKAFSQTLPENDPFLQRYEEPALIKEMIAQGYTGRKGKGGFYRLQKDADQKVKEAKCLQTGAYAPAKKQRLESVDAARGALRNLLEHEDIGGQYARAVMVPVLAYAASLVPEITDDVASVDEAMRLGYNWKYGPFELIDRLSDGDTAGSDWLIAELEKQNIAVPPLLLAAKGKRFYQEQEDSVEILDTNGVYQKQVVADDAWMLIDKKRGKKPVLKNASASLWDIGDGVACLEFTTKMNSVDPFVLEMIVKSIDKVKNEFKGLVIANDGNNFCVGANIGILLFAANVGAWKDIQGIIKQGQDTMLAIKYAPFPVVAAPSGMALGGGCETLLHCDAVQAHIETYTGLVEVGVGIIPGWGGCKEMIMRHLQQRLVADKVTAKLGKMFSFISPIKTLNTMPAVSKSFEYIATAKVAKSAEEARSMLILRDSDGITMNRKRLLPDAKAKCLALAEGYEPPQTHPITLPGKTAQTALKMAVASFVKSGKATAYDQVISEYLAKVLSGGNTDITKEITEQDLLDLEVQYFMELAKRPETLDRLEHMLEFGKPLRN